MATKTTQDILDIVNDWESLSKSDFIEELLEDMFNEEQREFILDHLQHNTPLKGDAR